ncbi:FAD-binding oxidoreductase [Gammaproteobacteria bacterium]|nr:FAD-binding oxidoreductase [Gammaproteobacteria bacterium]
MNTGMNPGLVRDLRAQLRGELLTDRFSRGRYATDASIYQMMPLVISVPRGTEDVRTLVELAAEHGCPLLPRGGGVSQCGQTVNNALVVDCTTHLNRLLDLDVDNRRCAVEPGIVLDELNRQLRPHGLWFPVDVSTSSRATPGNHIHRPCSGLHSIWMR